jgi:hypothetical protein
MVLSARRGPFIEDAADVIENDIETLFPSLEEFANTR